MIRGYIVFIYLLPIFPDDAICYIAGMTKIKIKTLMIISAIGRLPGFVVLGFIGAGLTLENKIIPIIILALVFIVSVIIFLKRERIEIIMTKLIKKITKKK